MPPVIARLMGVTIIVAVGVVFDDVIYVLRGNANVPYAGGTDFNERWQRDDRFSNRLS